MAAPQQVLLGIRGRIEITVATISSNTADYSLTASSLPGYIAGRTDVIVTVGSGVYVYSTNTANAGMTLTGFTTGDTCRIVNNGFIMGKGGDGAGTTLATPQAGGPAISIGTVTTIDNSNLAAYIGGGGGGGGRGANNGPNYGGGGGGAGGGAGGSAGGGGAGGNPGLAGANGGLGNPNGGGGGRLFPGTGGNGGTAAFVFAAGFGGTAGGGGSGYSVNATSNTGGAGGSAGAVGGAGQIGTAPQAYTNGGGGGTAADGK
jgi:hypothetical protein